MSRNGRLGKKHQIEEGMRKAIKEADKAGLIVNRGVTYRSTSGGAMRGNLLVKK